MTSHPFNLGGHSRKVSTRSPEAQTWFDRGLNWCFGFHQEEGIRCFKRALDHDPTCLMAHWGVAYGCGPFYNLAWHEFGVAEAAASTALATTHIAQARACYGQATMLEIELVEALACRFQQPHPVTREEYARWDDDYAAALRRVHFAHPDDLDVAALFVEALITRTPRRLWDVKTGRPAPNSDVLEALAICESAIALAEARGWAPHPAILHLHIHIMEMSNEPERAMRSADLLGEDVGITITQPFAATESGHEPLTSIPRKCSSNSWSEGRDPSAIGAGPAMTMGDARCEAFLDMRATRPNHPCQRTHFALVSSAPAPIRG